MCAGPSPPFPSPYWHTSPTITLLVISLQRGLQMSPTITLVGILSTSLKLSSFLVNSCSKSLSISGGDSSCSWVLVHGPNCERGVQVCNAG